jgi:hypothetical protein
MGILSFIMEGTKLNFGLILKIVQLAALLLLRHLMDVLCVAADENALSLLIVSDL